MHIPTTNAPPQSRRRGRTCAMVLALSIAPAACDGQDESEESFGHRGYTTNDTTPPEECDPPVEPIEVEPRRSLFESDEGVVGVFSLREVFEVIHTSAGHPASTAAALAPALYDSLWETFSVDGSTICEGPNGFPIRCDRNEANLLPGQIDQWKAIAAVNRFDLAAGDGSHCGEARIVFSNESFQRRAFMIFEAQIPNPDPECGIAACLPVQEFWASLSDQSNPGKRAEELHRAFITGHPELEAEGFGPFISASAFDDSTGQIRTNTFLSSPWNLREFKVDVHTMSIKPPSKGPSLGPVAAQMILPVVSIDQAPVAADIFRGLWDPGESWDVGASCREQILKALPGLLTDDVSKMGMLIGQECFSAESNANGGRYANEMSGTSFEVELDQRLDELGSALSPTQVANRATFSIECAGCHLPSGMNLGNNEGGPDITAPNSSGFGFIHTEDGSFDDCGGTAPAGTCFRISPALTDEFLPSRQANMEDFLNLGPCCEDNSIDPTGIIPIDPPGIDPPGIDPISPQSAIE